MTTNVYRTSRTPTITEKEVLLNPTIEIKTNSGYVYKIQWHRYDESYLLTPNYRKKDKVVIHRVIDYTHRGKHTLVKSVGNYIDTFSHLVKDLNAQLRKLWEVDSRITIDFTDMSDNKRTKSYIKSETSNSSLKANPMRAYKSKKVSDNCARMTGNIGALGKNFNKLI